MIGLLTSKLYCPGKALSRLSDACLLDGIRLLSIPNHGCPTVGYYRGDGIPCNGEARVGMLSTEEGYAVFTRVNRRNWLEHQMDVSADLISYNLSTTGGASGSAISDSETNKLLDIPAGGLTCGAWLTIGKNA